MNYTHSLIISYNEKINSLQKEITKQQKGINFIFYTRLLSFILAFIVFFLTLQQSVLFASLLTIVIIILFLFLLKKELRAQREIEYLKNRILLNEREILRLNNQLTSFDTGKEFLNKEHPFMSDLDIFGDRSIFQLLNRTCTYTGKIKLTKWMITPLLYKVEIEQRQKAVCCLSKKLEWGQRFIATGMSANENESDSDIIRKWLTEENHFSSVFLKSLSVALPIVTILALMLQLMNVIGSGAFTALFLLQLWVIGSKLKKTNRIHNQLSRKLNTVEKYSALIDMIETEDFEAETLKRLKNELTSGNIRASIIINKLKKIVNTLDARLNMIVGIVLNGIFLFDINVMIRLENWKKIHKTDFLKWIDIIGEFDAFISLGIYAHNNPEYTYPDISTEEFLIHTERIGHPLINKSKLVKNNYSINGLSHVDLLTGANMAGKSTFLRTIGVNLTLAMIGLPVCADKFTFTPIRLFTSLRTNDSLQENESFFYAELKRLHQLIQQYEKGEKVFFLLDEILKGTNSKDQHHGSEALIKKMIFLKGVGIVATHDVELSKLVQDFPKNIRNLCFEITIDNDKLSFDYQVKNGVCSTMNASFLMKKMGII